MFYDRNTLSVDFASPLSWPREISEDSLRRLHRVQLNGLTVLPKPESEGEKGCCRSFLLTCMVNLKNGEFDLKAYWPTEDGYEQVSDEVEMAAARQAFRCSLENRSLVGLDQSGLIYLGICWELFCRSEDNPLVCDL